MKSKFLLLILSLCSLFAQAQQDTLFLDQGVVTLATATGSTTIPSPISYEVQNESFRLRGGNGSVLSFELGQIRKFYLSGAAQTVSTSGIASALTDAASSRARPLSRISNRTTASVYEFQTLDALGVPNLSFTGTDYLGFRLYNWSADTISFTFSSQDMKCLPYSSFTFMADYDQETGRYFPCPDAEFNAPSSGRAVVVLIPIQTTDN